MQSGAALGMIETIGLIGTAEAADAMAKTAAISIVTYETIENGYSTTLVRGDVGAVLEATSAGAEAATKVGAVVAVHVIPNLHPEVEKVFLGSKK